MKQPDKAHAAWRLMLARENVRASFLQAKHERITKLIAAIVAERKQAA